MRSAGPLISKLRNSEFARKRSRVSSIMSASLGSPEDKVYVNPDKYYNFLRNEISPMGVGPRILVLIGRIDMFPTWRTSGTSLKDE